MNITKQRTIHMLILRYYPNLNWLENSTTETIEQVSGQIGTAIYFL